MSLLTHEQRRDVIATHDFRSPADGQRALKGLLADTLQAMLDGELETHRVYPQDRAGPKPTPNRHNGRHPKHGPTEYGEVALEILRDRGGSFTSVVVPPHQTTMVGREAQSSPRRRGG